MYAPTHASTKLELNREMVADAAEGHNIRIVVESMVGLLGSLGAK